MNAEISTYSSYALLMEIRGRELRKKLDASPEDIRYFILLSNAIIGAQNAGRIPGTSAAVVNEGEEFVSKLLAMGDPHGDERFRGILKEQLVDCMRDELKKCCVNCVNFSGCLDADMEEVGTLFRKRANGEDTPEARKRISELLDDALKNTPYASADNADELCGRFRHHYKAEDIGEVFGRYLSIASEFEKVFGIDYRNVQSDMIALNMTFCENRKE